jgi:hypothetical protein
MRFCGFGDFRGVFTVRLTGFRGFVGSGKIAATPLHEPPVPQAFSRVRSAF